MNEAVGQTISRTLPNSFKGTAGYSVNSPFFLGKNRNCSNKRLELIESPQINLGPFHGIPVLLW